MEILSTTERSIDLDCKDVSVLRIAMLMSEPLPPKEGIGNYVHNLSNKLAKKGHDVVVITRGGLKEEALAYSNYTVFKLPFLMAYPFHVDIHRIFIDRFLEAYSRDLDIIHVHSPLVPNVSTRIPIMTTFHTPLFVNSNTIEFIDIHSLLLKVLEKFAYRIERSLISSSRLVTAVSEGVASDLENWYGIKSNDIPVLGNAVDDIFLKSGSSISSHRDGNIIMYAGRIDYRKGVLDLVKSMKIVTERIPTTKLIILGKGPLLPRLIKLINSLKLRNNVDVRGFVSRRELLNISLKASIFVLPSYYEGLPTAILEAMACQLSVVTTNVCGNRDLVKNGDTGMLVPPREPKYLAEAIIYLVEHPEFRQKVARNARMMVENRFTWDKVTERVLEAYNRSRADI